MAGEIIQYQTEDGATVTRAINAPSAVEQHFVKAMDNAQAIEASQPAVTKKGKA